MEQLSQDCKNLFLVLVGMDVKVGIAREHGRQLRLGLVVEDVAGDATMLGISEFITHAQRWTGTLGDEQIALPQPGGILVIDVRIALTSLFIQDEIAAADVLGEHGIGLLHELDDAAIEVGIDAPSPNRASKVYFLIHESQDYIAKGPKSFYYKITVKHIPILFREIPDH